MGWAGREGLSELCRDVRSESRGACAALQQLLLPWHFSHTEFGVKPGLAQLLVNLGGFPHTAQGAMFLQKGMQTSVWWLCWGSRLTFVICSVQKEFGASCFPSQSHSL